MSKPLTPILLVATISILCSYFISFAWLFPLLIVIFYWMPIDYHSKEYYGKDIKYVPKGSLSFLNSVGKKVTVMFGRPTRTFGIFKPTIVYSPSKKYPSESFNHELGHIYFNHVLLNAIYFTFCCVFVSFSLTISPVMTVLVAIAFIPLTNYKTLKMEIAADRMANTFENIIPMLNSLPDSWFKRKRLAALNGSSAT